MKTLATILLSFFVFTSCQKKDSPPKNEVNDSDITADVLSKISSKFEYRSRENIFTVSNDGTFRLIFDALVQKKEAGLKTLKQNEARCLLDFSGKVNFFRSPGVLPSAPLYSQAEMKLTGTSVLKSEATRNTAEGTDPNEFCHDYHFAAFKQNKFENYVLSYDGMSVVFAGLYFNVKEKSDTETSQVITNRYLATPYSGDTAEFDIVRMNMPLIYFVKNAGDVDMTETAFNDLHGKMKSDNTAAPALNPLEMVIRKEKELKTISVDQTECGLSYTFYVQSVRAKTEGIFIKLLAHQNTVPETLSDECALLNENLKRLGGETRMSYATQTKDGATPDNRLKLFIRQADDSIFSLSFKSK